MKIEWTIYSRPGLIGPPPDAYLKASWMDKNHYHKEDNEPILSFSEDEWQLAVERARVRILERIVDESTN